MPQRDGGVEWKGGHQWRFVQRMAVGLSLLYIRVGSKPFNHPKARQNAACPTPSALLSPKRLFGGSSILPTKSIPAASLLLLSLVIAKRSYMQGNGIMEKNRCKIRMKRNRPYSCNNGQSHDGIF
jgi:hypothetical protein